MNKTIINGVEIEVTKEQKDMLRACASHDEAIFVPHRKAVAQVVNQAWQTGVLEPDLLGNIFMRSTLEPGVTAKYPLNFYAPANEGSYVAIRLPRQGAIPERVVEGDELLVTTYKIGNAISWSLDYARDARWDVVAQAMEVYNNGFVRKLNDDGWHVILRAALDSTATAFVDTSATAGQFSKQVLLNMMAGIKRQTGGRNSRLTDIYLSPEGINDIRNFSNTQIDEVSRRELVTSGEDRVPSLYGVNLHEIQEFGVGEEYELFISSNLGRSHNNSKVEFFIGLDQLHRDAFVMPVREDMQMFDDPALHRSAKMGVYGWMELGFACLDTRRAVLGEF